MGFNHSDFIAVSEFPGIIGISKRQSHNGNTWLEAHREVAKDSPREITYSMSTFPIFKRHYTNVVAAREHNKPLYDGNRTKIIKKDVKEIYRILTSDCYAWQDAYFKKVNDIFRVDCNHRIVDGELQPMNSEPLESCLMNDRLPGIDLSGWLDNSTSQGLPKPEINTGDLFYWCPINRSVARFISDSVRVDLCNGDPLGSDAAVGVFVCVEGAQKSLNAQKN